MKVRAPLVAGPVFVLLGFFLVLAFDSSVLGGLFIAFGFGLLVWGLVVGATPPSSLALIPPPFAHCPSCGHANPFNAPYCESCGHPIERSADVPLPEDPSPSVGPGS